MKQAEALVAGKAYELLASQPGTLKGLTRAERARLVIAAVSDLAGGEHVVSRFGDQVWDFRSSFKVDNRPESSKLICWPKDIPAAIIDEAKAVLYVWHKRGRPGVAPASPPSLQGAVSAGVPTLRWLVQRGVRNVDDITPLRMSTYIQHLREQGKAQTTIYRALEIVDLLWEFRAETTRQMCAHPWGQGLNLAVVSRRTRASLDEADDATTGKTPLIPPSVRVKLLAHCDSLLASAPTLLDQRDAGQLPPLDSALIAIRDACLFVLSISTGMRNSEAVGVSKDCSRSEDINGVTFHWVRTVEHKTGKGEVDYLAPPEVLEVLRIMERFAEPLQARLTAEITRLRWQAEREHSPADRTEVLQRIAVARQSSTRLFLGKNTYADDGTGDGSRIDVVTNGAANSALQRLAEAAGVDWRLSTHQCRRTYARAFVESRMGRKSLLFLKWQLKHSSLSMTQLYAANPKQDSGLYDDFLDEMIGFRMEVLESWLDTDHLSGGMGRKIAFTIKAIPVESRESLLAHTAESVHIRSTGHAWCLAQERGCGGAGLYEATRCSTCKDGVIDEGFAQTWRGIYEQQLELCQLQDVGPAVQQRARRDAERAKLVLAELGIEPKPYTAV